MRHKNTSSIVANTQTGRASKKGSRKVAMVHLLERTEEDNAGFNGLIENL